MVKNIVIIDDEQVRHDFFKEFFKNSSNDQINLIHLYTPDEIRNFFLTNKEKIHTIYFDHDLDQNNSGPDMSSILRELAFMDDVTIFAEEYVIHSMNHVGAKNIQSLLLSRWETDPAKILIVPFWKIKGSYE